MRRTVLILVLMVVALLALVLSIALFSRLAPLVGIAPVGFMTLAAGLGAAWAGTHTAESKAVAEDFLGALAEIGMTRKEAAGLMNMSVSQLDRQLAGYDMLVSPYRLATLGSRFREAYHRRAVEREQRGQYLANAILIDILNTVRERTGRRTVTSVGNRTEAA